MERKEDRIGDGDKAAAWLCVVVVMWKEGTRAGGRGEGEAAVGESEG
eukprot:SAG31_NODE_12659_length_926_cov_1.030230_1_plen_46_part_01